MRVGLSLFSEYLGKYSLNSSSNKLGIDSSFYQRNPLELSGGEKRKVALASILAFNPETIIYYPIFFILLALSS